MVSMEKDFNRMYNYIFSDLCAALGCSKAYGSLVVFFFFKKLENGTAPVTQDRAVDKACSKPEIQKFKRS